MKISLLKSWAGPELLQYWERDVCLRWETIPAVAGVNGGPETPEKLAHTYEELIKLTRTACRLEDSRQGFSSLARAVTILITIK